MNRHKVYLGPISSHVAQGKTPGGGSTGRLCVVAGALLSFLLASEALATHQGEEAGPDLAPSSVFTMTFVPPPRRGCVVNFSEIAPPVTSVCVDNLGTRAAGAFDVLLEGSTGTDEFRVNGLTAGGLRCVDRQFLGNELHVIVDRGDEVEEVDETNNEAVLNVPPPTLTPPLTCTRTPSVTPTVPPGSTATFTPTYTPTATPTATRTPTKAPCIGDGNGDGRVIISELVTAVNNALRGCP